MKETAPTTCPNCGSHNVWPVDNARDTNSYSIESSYFCEECNNYYRVVYKFSYAES